MASFNVKGDEVKRILSGIKTLMVWGVVLGLTSYVVDYWRRPADVSAFAMQPIQLIGQHQEQSLAKISEDQVAVLYFWGSWCGVCRYTSPAVQQLHEDGIPVVGVALQSGQDTDITAYLQKNNWNFPSMNDAQGSFSRLWQIKVTPTLVLLKNGRVIHTTTGIGSYWGLKTRIWLAQYFA